MTVYTLDSPPPVDPPAELTGGHGIWRVMRRTWTEHHPVTSPNGRRCQVPGCRRPWGTDGCPGFRAASHILEHMRHYPAGTGVLGYPRMQQVLRGESHLTGLRVRA